MEDEAAVSDDPKPTESTEKPAESKEIEDFFHRLPANFRWPRPNPDAVAAAVEAIQRISGGASVAQDLAAANQPELPDTCAACGGTLPATARFCVWCGLPREGTAAGPISNMSIIISIIWCQDRALPRVRLPPMVSCRLRAERLRCGHSSARRPRRNCRSPNGSGLGAGLQYPAHRRPSRTLCRRCHAHSIERAPVRSLPAIREFLSSVLEAGLGDVQMESLRLEIMGDIAMDIGRCKMLVPTAMGKRREERGKYLVVMVRQPVGTWKILADCWSSDLPVNAPPEPAPRKGSDSTASGQKRG